MNWYLEVLRKYAVFVGRARRKEYWIFVLGNVIIGFVIGLVMGIAGANPNGVNVPVLLFQLAILIPSLAVGVRRMHDTDHSGWWLLVPIVNLVFAVSAGTHGSNRFGVDPKLAA